ncbi:MAG: Fic family protein [Candidatus Pacebacteria bacterium]|nr:Fic family protein [Candidatus Paceibacterota bacterium]
MKISQKQAKILSIILKNGALSSSAIYKNMVESDEKISLVTIKRALSEMADLGLVNISGSGPSTNYNISIKGRLFFPVNAKEYCATEPDKRFGLDKYNFELIGSIPKDIFEEEELKLLEDATQGYKKRIDNISDVIQKKELERLVIELAWKSSKIEGNTYTLLDTERLILENKEAAGHDKKEAQMILNHKEAFTFIHQNLSFFQELTRQNLEKLHSILVQNLNVNFGLRRKLVGIVGSKYKPLDNGYQIEEAVNSLSKIILAIDSPYAKALIAFIGISYIQPFEDGNKRTGRLMTNALLLSHNLAPLSYRSVDEKEYREAMLSFYEINSLIPIKKIFIDQYVFAANNYAVK